jgi:MYXO-CTERM domain-containing protein
VTLTGETDDTPYTPDAGVTADASSTPDAGPTDGPKDKGCGCAAAEGEGGPLGLLLLGLLAFVWIRRRRS